jgi:hypothetical protein
MSPRENSVKQLSEFYNVVTGVALALAITKLIDPALEKWPVRTDLLLNFGTFLLVIIPFHQGAVRHLFATYVEGGGSKRITRGALAIDFLLLFLNACVFVGLAQLIEKTNLFVIALIVLLCIDCIWGALTFITLSGAQAQTAEKYWSLINLIAAAVITLATIFGPPLVGGWGTDMKIAIFVICFIRTAVDYYICWDFYYPTTN